MKIGVWILVNATTRGCLIQQNAKQSLLYLLINLCGIFEINIPMCG